MGIGKTYYKFDDLLEVASNRGEMVWYLWVIDRKARERQASTINVTMADRCPPAQFRTTILRCNNSGRDVLRAPDHSQDCKAF